MKLANATAVLQCVPLALAFSAAVFLKEDVGWRRWSAIVFGFFGVLIIIKPTSTEFNYYSLMALMAVCFIVLRDLSTSRLNESIPSTFVSLITALSVTITGLLFLPFQTWVKPSFEIIGSLSATAVLLILGVLFNIISMRTGEVSFIAPYRYSIIIFAILYGIIFYNEFPDKLMIFGSIILVSAGLYTLYREQIKKEL